MTNPNETQERVESFEQIANEAIDKLTATRGAVEKAVADIKRAEDLEWGDDFDAEIHRIRVELEEALR